MGEEELVVEQAAAISVVSAFLIDLFATLLSQTSYLMMKYAHIEADKSDKSAYMTC